MLKATAAHGPGGMRGEGKGSRCGHLVGVGLNRRGVLAGAWWPNERTIWAIAVCLFFSTSLAAGPCLALYEAHHIVHYPGEAQ